jgi:hypothetical protein
MTNTKNRGDKEEKTTDGERELSAEELDAASGGAAQPTMEGLIADPAMIVGQTIPIAPSPDRALHDVGSPKAKA